MDNIKYIKQDDCKIFYFLSEDITPEERFRIFKMNDTENHYSYNMPEKELLEFCNRLIRENEFIKNQCIQYNLPFFETSIDRNKVFKKFIKMIKNE